MDPSEQDTKLCKNCKREISCANFLTHEVHCTRKISLCDKCDKPVTKTELQDHFREIHQLIQCQKCQEYMENQHLQSHQVSSCGSRLLKCSYCEIETAAKDLDEHEDYCGSRTDICEGCGRYVMLKNRIVHEASGHTIETSIVRNSAPSPSDVGPVISSILGSFRPSACKRTNDMPQVNTHSRYAADLSKDVHKPVIDPRREGIRSSLSQEDMDELLAMHMQQDPTLDVLGLDPEPTYRPVLGPRRNIRTPSPPPRRSQSEPDDPVMLPCEFCNELFTAEDIEGHQAECRLHFPDDPLNVRNFLRHDLEPEIETDLRFTNNLYKPDDTPTSVANPEFIEIPCEYCNKPFPVDYIIQHQSACEFLHTTEAPGHRPIVFKSLDDEDFRRPAKHQPEPGLYEFLREDETRSYSAARPEPKVREVPINVDRRHPSLAKNNPQPTSAATASADPKSPPLTAGARPKGANGRRPVAAPRARNQTPPSDQERQPESGERRRTSPSSKPVYQSTDTQPPQHGPRR